MCLILSGDVAAGEVVLIDAESFALVRPLAVVRRRVRGVSRSLRSGELLGVGNCVLLNLFGEADLLLDEVFFPRDFFTGKADLVRAIFFADRLDGDIDVFVLAVPATAETELDLPFPGCNLTALPAGEADRVLLVLLRSILFDGEVLPAADFFREPFDDEAEVVGVVRVEAG